MAGQFWLAINNHQNIVGTIGLIRLDNNMSALKKMFVDKGYRNLKIGKKLLDKVIMTCKETKYHYLFNNLINLLVHSIFILIMVSVKLSEEIYQVVFLN